MDQALQTMINNMPEKTGKSLAEWQALLKTQNFGKHSEAVKYLKTEHGVTHGFANTIVTLSKEEQSSDADLVTAQYTGKEALMPIYQRLLDIVQAFGDDVQIVPKKGSVSIKTGKHFALIKPATKTRIDLGLKLKDVEPAGRLGPSGPFGTMCTHRVQLTAVAEVDQEVSDWLALAYQKSC